MAPPPGVGVVTSDHKDGRPSILLVDGDQERRQSITASLLNDYLILVAEPGADDIAAIVATRTPDLVILGMSDGHDAFATCRRLKSSPRSSRTPIVFVGNFASVGDEVQAFDLGAIDMLHWPLSPRLLQARIRNHVHHAYQARSLQNRVAERTRELELQTRERKAARARAEFLALNDPQTGLPNRRQLHQQIEKILHNRSDDRFGVLHFNIDRLGLINHSAGLAKADAVLAQFAHRLKAACGSSDFVARADSDNFIMLLPLGVCEAQSARQKIRSLANTLRRQLAQPVQKMVATTCVGTVLVPDDAADAHTALSNALVALRRAKERGPNSTVAFTAEFGQAAHDEHQLERQLQTALNHGELEVHFQPIVDLNHARISGAECLIRCPDGRGGYISNGSFLPVAENTGLIHGLDDELLQQAVDWLASHPNLPSGFRLSLNLSAASLARPLWLESLPDALSRQDVPTERLELEITEQNLIKDLSDTSRRLRNVSDSGIQIAADDFGSGYSSLAWLENLPIDRVKLDRQFISRVEESPKAQAIASSMIRLMNDLGLECVIEGIETARQLRFASEEGATYGQGFGLFRPMPRSQFDALLEQSDSEIQSALPLFPSLRQASGS